MSRDWDCWTQPSMFRTFCYNQWILHCEECEGYDGKYPDYDSKEYFRRMKWFLKYQFKSRP